MLLTCNIYCQNKYIDDQIDELTYDCNNAKYYNQCWNNHMYFLPITILNKLSVASHEINFPKAFFYDEDDGNAPDDIKN